MTKGCQKKKKREHVKKKQFLINNHHKIYGKYYRQRCLDPDPICPEWLYPV